MRVELIRHGETLWQGTGRYQGQTDVPLSEQGRQALSPASFSPEKVYITALQRTRQTAERLFPQARLVVVEDLGEMNFGRFEGRSAAEMEEDPSYRAWVEGMCRAAASPASKEIRLWLALWGLLAADYIFKISALYYYDAVQTWEFFALHLAAAYWVLARAGALTEGRTGPFLPLDGLRALVTVPFGNFFLRIRVLLRALAGWLQGLAGRK